MTTAAVTSERPSRSVFAGADIAATALLAWRKGYPRPRFEDEVWSFTGWADAPVQMSLAEKTWRFDRIRRPAWRVVAKEVALAWLAAGDSRVLAVPRARRVPRHPRTIQARIYHLTFWLNWLHERHIPSLAAITQDHCDAFLRDYGVVRDRSGQVVRPKSGSTLRTVVSAMQEIADYGELLSADGHRTGFRPWGETSPRVITGAPSRPQVVIKTSPLSDDVLAPLLTACLHMIDELGPHVADLRRLRRADQQGKDAQLVRRLFDKVRLTALVDGHLQAGSPLPRLDPRQIAMRKARGWDPEDPLLEVNFVHLLRPTGHRDIAPNLFRQARPMLEEAVTRVGVEYVWCRSADLVPRADTGEMVPWSLPMPSVRADSLVRAAGHACIVATSALTGMRASELMELTVGCHRTGTDDGTGLVRHRLVSKVIKARRWGGEVDEWVVVEEVVRAIALAEQLTDATTGQLLFGPFQGFNSNGAMDWLRQWVASPAGQRLGLAPIPGEPIHPRRLRRTLAVEMGARPGGLFATKVHFKHLSVATSEGYAARPGGAQAGFHQEWKQAEAKEKLARTVEAFRQFQQGQLPAGPGADALMATFRTVEGELEGHDPGPAKVVTDRQVELLLKKKAAALHLSAANYCWFEDPAKALCLKLAGAKSASAPLTGLCDSARCPQATHHIAHRFIWQNAADNGAVLLASPRIPPAEKDRLRAEHERSMRVLEEIDTAAGKAG
ncbi:hypothetical protein [Streptomyces parvulus]|uniref:hypothetical protein n=1 Tax=Streptomyces parvulus TaxID=146923 RepID=UPI0033CA9CEC